MLSDDRTQQLQHLLAKLKIGGIVKERKAIQGQIIEILKTIYYFKGQAETYGIQVLQYYIPIIQPYILRVGMQIIDNSEQYVVMQGIVCGRKQSGQLGNVYSDGRLIDPSLELNKNEHERENFVCSDEMDAKLIKIIKTGGDGTSLVKKAQTLAKFQKERLALSREIQKAIHSDPAIQTLKQKILKFQFFQKMCSYDFNDIITRSKFLLLKKGTYLHRFGSLLNKLCFIITGLVKIDNSLMNEIQKIGVPGKLILQKYMIHKKQSNQSIVNLANPGDWINLQEYLCGEQILSTKAEVVSHDAQILFVDIELFKQKFNPITQYNLINKLKGLSQTKKKILDRSIRAKRDKQNEVSEELLRAQAIFKFEKKFRTYQMGQNAEKSAIISRKVQKYLSNDRKRTSFSLNQSSQFLIPDTLVHQVKIKQPKHEIALPKVSQRFVLFPQEYQHALIPKELKDQLKILNKKRTQNLAKLEKSFKLLKNEKLYEKIIFDSLNHQRQNPQSHCGSVMLKKTRRTSIQSDNSHSVDFKKQLKETCLPVPQYIPKTHYNNSICNNFKVPKNSPQKVLTNLYKTLEIN